MPTSELSPLRFRGSDSSNECVLGRSSAATASLNRVRVLGVRADHRVRGRLDVLRRCAAFGVVWSISKAVLKGERVDCAQGTCLTLAHPASPLGASQWR